MGLVRIWDFNFVLGDCTYWDFFLQFFLIFVDFFFWIYWD